MVPLAATTEINCYFHHHRAVPREVAPQVADRSIRYLAVCCCFLLLRSP